MFSTELLGRGSRFGHLDHPTLLLLGVGLQPLPRQPSTKEVHEDVPAAWSALVLANSSVGLGIGIDNSSMALHLCWNSSKTKNKSSTKGGVFGRREPGNASFVQGLPI